MFDCRGCSFPSTLRHLNLKVAKIREDGAFQRGMIQQTDRMHVSFKAQGSNLDLGAFALGTKRVSMAIGLDGSIELWMPEQHDIVWQEVLNLNSELTLPLCQQQS